MRIVIFFIITGLIQTGYGQCIDIETAWQRILHYAPSIAAADAQICILEGEAKQVSLLPNPIFEVESENLGVSHPSDDVEPPQTTFSLAQLIELGGKRSARGRLASSLSGIAYWDAQIERENMRLELMQAFIEVRTAEEKWCIASERLEISEAILEVTKKQIQNGKLSPIQEKRARIGLMAERLAVREAFSAYEQAKTRLSLMWGCSCPDFDDVIFDLYECAPPPCQTILVNGFYQTPDYFRAQQAIRSASRNLSLQKANRIPDITLMGGYRVFHDSNTGGWVVGAEMPLPVFDRNQGNVKSANCGLAQAQYSFEEAAREARERIFGAYGKLTAAYEEAEEMCQCILREAQEALQLTESGYKKGKFEYLEVLDARKMFFEIQERCIDVLCEYHLNRAELARLSGLRI